MAEQQMIDGKDLINAGLGYKATDQVADLSQGATMGIGLKSFIMDASTPMVFPPAFFIVLQTPFMYSDNRFAVKRRIMKTLMESHAKEISGIDVEYSMDSAEGPAGHDGQQQGVPTRNKRNAISPSMVIPEVHGGLVWRFFTQWGRDILDPDTQASFSHLSDKEAIPFVSSSYSITAAVIQPDPSFLPQNIVDGVFLTNMWPTTAGSLGIQRTIGTSNTMDRTINFQAVLRHNDKTRDIMVQIAQQLKLGQLRSGGQMGMPTAASVEDFVTGSNLAKEIASIE